MNAKPAAIAIGMGESSFANMTADMMIPPQIIRKSRTFQNHSLTVALRFSG